MGIPDLRTRISNAQAVTTDDVADSSIDLGAADKQIGISRLILHVFATTAFTGLDSGLTIKIIDGTGVDGSGEINAGELIVIQTPVIPQSEFLTGGVRHWQIELPPGKRQRYLSARYTPASEAGVAGKFTSHFDSEPESEVR